jgi:hypothetical protein
VGTTWRGSKTSPFCGAEDFQKAAMLPTWGPVIGTNKSEGGFPRFGRQKPRGYAQASDGTTVKKWVTGN